MSAVQAPYDLEELLTCTGAPRGMRFRRLNGSEPCAKRCRASLRSSRTSPSLPEPARFERLIQTPA